MAGCKDGNASGAGGPLTFEYAENCGSQILRIGNRVVLPCPLKVEEICLQNTRNVNVEVTVKGRALAWDPETCTFGLAPELCEQLAEFPDALTDNMGSLIGFDTDGNCAQFPPPDLCAMLKLLPQLDRGARAGEYVLGLTADGQCVLFAVGNQKAVDDVDLTPRPVGKPFAVNTAGNDIPCANGTTWVLIPGSEHNVNVTPAISPDGQFTATPIDCSVGAVAADDVDPFKRPPGEPFTLNIATNDTGCADGVWSFDYELYCDGVATGSRATASGLVECTGGPIATNDRDFTPRPVGVTFPKQVSTNDIGCPGTATTYVLRSGSPQNVTVSPAVSSDGIFYVTPNDCSIVADALDDVVGGAKASGVPFTFNVGTNDTPCQPGVWSFEYEIYCGGAPSGATAIVNGTVDCGLPVAVNDTVATPLREGVATTVQTSTNDTPCPYGATTWRLISGSESNVTVSPALSSTGSFNVTAATGLCAPTAAAVDDVVLGSEPVGNAVDDPNVAVVANTPTTVNAGANDQPWTLALIAGKPYTVNVATNDTPCAPPAPTWSFRYELLCNGAATGVTATVTGTVTCP